MAGKQAKILTDSQARSILNFLETTRYPSRDRVMFLLSRKAGLRAKEIGLLQWLMVVDGDGEISEVITLPDSASKGKSGRTIPINKELKQALIDWFLVSQGEPEDFIITSERGGPMSAKVVVMWFSRLYKELGFQGCSSHSGRRTFITKGAKKITEAGGSLRDIQQLAGHSSLNTTQRYIEGDTQAKRKLVDLI